MTSQRAKSLAHMVERWAGRHNVTITRVSHGPQGDIVVHSTSSNVKFNLGQYDDADQLVSELNDILCQ